VTVEARTSPGSPDKRFAFGANWQRFIDTVDEKRIDYSVRAVSDLLQAGSLAGKRFLDVGCGSGLSSLAARRLGALVHGFDYDTGSVGASHELRRRFATGDTEWTIERGSALDGDYLSSLGTWDIVYSWGVLHHTGKLWQALEAVGGLVVPGGKLAIAIYNDQGYISRRWLWVKRNYVQYAWLRPLLVAGSLAAIWGWPSLLDLRHLRPFRSWRDYRAERGMSAWHDLIDWVGGYPFEVATPDAVFDCLSKRGFTLRRLITRQGKGCNEFMFTRDSA